MAKPGIMIYFEICPCLEMMTIREKGELLDALLSYGQTGEDPPLKGRLYILWPLIRDRLDRDTKRYENIVMRNKYASYAKSAGKGKLSYEDWKAQNYPNQSQWES